MVKQHLKKSESFSISFGTNIETSNINSIDEFLKTLIYTKFHSLIPKNQDFIVFRPIVGRTNINISSRYGWTLYYSQHLLQTAVSQGYLCQDQYKDQTYYWSNLF